MKIDLDIDHKKNVAHQYGFFGASLIYYLQKMVLCTDYNKKVCHQYGFLYAFLNQYHGTIILGTPYPNMVGMVQKRV